MPMQTLCRHCAWNGSGKLSLKNPAFVQALRQEATLSLTGAWSQISKGNCRNYARIQTKHYKTRSAEWV